jgi:hypothetical protein
MTPHAVPYLNTSYLFKTMRWTEEGGDEELHLESCFNRFVGGSLPGKEADAARQFLARHRGVIERDCRLRVRIPPVEGRKYGKCVSMARALYLPVCLGGVGLVRPKGFRTELTGLQKRVAWALQKDAHPRPFPFVEDERLETRAISPWEVDKPASQVEIVLSLPEEQNPAPIKWAAVGFCSQAVTHRAA